jgi:hypothetical protein
MAPRHQPFTAAITGAGVWRIAEREQLVPANAWLRTSASVEIIEHATASKEFRTVLSMLWVPEPVAGPLGMAA